MWIWKDPNRPSYGHKAHRMKMLEYEMEKKAEENKEEQEEERTYCKWYERHPWSRWEVNDVGKTEHGWPTVIQKRECKRCGKIQFRRERSDW
jgi:hypothetical protein